MYRLTNNILFNEYTIDSLSIRFDLDDVTILDHKLTSQYIQVLQQTGEVVQEYNHEKEQLEDLIHEAKPLILKDSNGFTVSFRYLKRYDVNKKKNYECISFTISSKILCKEYYQGITRNNAKTIYNYLQSLKVIRLKNFNQFLRSRVYDVDLCYNFISSEESFLNTIKHFDKYVTRGKGKFVEPFKVSKKESWVLKNYKLSPFLTSSNFINLGIKFNDRKRHKTPTTPPVHSYSKFHDFIANPKHNKFPILNDLPVIRNHRRIESNIFNSEHVKRINRLCVSKPLKTFNDYLSLTTEHIRKIIFFNLMCYADPLTKNYKVFSSLSPIDIVLLTALKNNSIDVLVDDISCRKRKSQTRKKLQKLHITHVVSKDENLPNNCPLFDTFTETCSQF